MMSPKRRDIISLVFTCLCFYLRDFKLLLTLQQLRVQISVKQFGANKSGVASACLIQPK